MTIINHPIKPEKGKAWHWISHQYFTKQASNVVAAYIEHYTQEGDTVADPFCGTGVTAIEALRLKRKAVVSDINPLACFITEQNCRKIDIDAAAAEFKNITSSVKPEIQRYYSMSDSEIDQLDFSYWYPDNITLPKNSDFTFVHDLFSRRQLISHAFLFYIINQIKDTDLKNFFRFVFSANISKVNLTYMPSEKNGRQVGGGGASIFGTYRYWKPPVFRELDVWSNFEYRFKKILKGKQIWNDLTKDIDIDKNLKVINGSVLDLTKYILENSVDYIYTDPPYGGNIAYLDLSTMWNAWLGFDVDDSLKKEEIIEGGDLDKTQEDYESLLSKSFGQMSRILKKDKWLSLVFAHKKLEFWNLIIDANEDNGLEFKGSVYQPTNNSSVHFKKNPANVLCSQRIANFQKTFERSAREKPDDLKEFILNEIERACLEGRGAAIDVIYQRVLDQLLKRHVIHEAKKRGYLKLDQFLDNSEQFVLNEDTHLYYLKDQDNQSNQFEQDYFRNRNELEIYLKSLLSQKKSLSLDEIHRELFEIYADEKKFPVDKLHKDLQDILNDIAVKSPKTGKWIISKKQTVLSFEKAAAEKLVRIHPGKSTHSELIFRLVQIGKYLGYSSLIGKREQSTESFQGYKFSEISVPDISLENAEKHQSDKIKQIDCIWTDNHGIPKYAFEIEESTNIMTGFERFKNLLEVKHDLSKHLFIVSPKSRRRKIEDVFKNSVYIGHPLYLENKIGLIYREELVKFYEKHTDEKFDEADFVKVFEDMEI